MTPRNKMQPHIQGETGSRYRFYRAGSQGAESRLIPGKNNLFLFYARENEARPHQKKHQWKC
jgi:hypothetical protein